MKAPDALRMFAASTQCSFYSYFLHVTCLDSVALNPAAGPSLLSHFQKLIEDRRPYVENLKPAKNE